MPAVSGAHDSQHASIAAVTAESGHRGQSSWGRERLDELRAQLLHYIDAEQQPQMQP